MPLATPTVLLGFLLPWTWGISSRLLQQSAAAAPYLGRGLSPHGHASAQSIAVVDGTGDRSKVQCCKEQYCIGTWDVRSTNQEVVKQEMPTVNIDILGINELNGLEWVKIT